MNREPHVSLQPVSWKNVSIRDDFWTPRLEANRNATIEHGFRMLSQHGYEENFIRAGQRLEGGFQGLVYQDSDVYKLLQSAAASLATHPDNALRERLDYWFGLIEAAQLEDGYINTHFQLIAPDKKWQNLRDWHELYCAGHLIEAGVTDYVGNGRDRLLQVAIKAANHIDERFGPEKAPGYPGHPELELALIRLFEATSERRYYDLARHFVRSRGRHYFAHEHGTPETEYDGAYWQDRVPIVDMDVIEGHAVRAVYLLCAATDIVRETQDADLEDMLHRVWNNAVIKRMYVTGGIGNSAKNEGFTEDYDLPNETAYQETCASIAMVFWNHRLALLYGKATYADYTENALYNGVLAGISLDGTRFFYENPLASSGDHHRKDWYACACCPPNISRLLSSLGDYVYAKGDGAFYVNLFIAGSVETEVGGRPFAMHVQTEYPWHSIIVLTPKSTEDVDLHVRIPSWCKRYSIKLSGETIEPAVENGYAVVRSQWTGDKTVEVVFDMPAYRIESNPAIGGNTGRVAVCRGPMVYCFEQCDHSSDLRGIFLPPNVQFRPEKDQIFGVTALTGTALQTRIWDCELYRQQPELQPVSAKAIPYAFWDNREQGRMAVWMPTFAPAYLDN